METLKCLDVSCVTTVPYKNEIICAKLKKVTDGDTICVVILLGGNYPLQITIRILGVDTPESVMRPGVTKTEKEAGKCMKEYIKSLFVEGEIYNIILKDLDKYSGRYLGDVYLKDGSLLSNVLLNGKLARVYNGEAKPAWDMEFLEAIIKRFSNA